MRVKRLLKIFLAVALCLPATGCWDALDINDRDIITAVLVDKTDYGYAFYVEVPRIAASGNGAESSQPKKPTILKAEGRDYVEARANIDRQLDKPIFLGSVQSVLLTDRLASFGIEEYLYRLREVNEYRKTVHVVVTTEDPEKLLNDVPENSQSTGFAIESTIMSLVTTGQLQHVSLMDILEILSSPYKHYILPTMALVNDEPSVTGFTVFSGGMKTGFIPIADAKSIIFMQSTKPKLLYTVPYKDTWVTLEVNLPDKSIKPHDSDGKLSFDIDLSFKAILLYPENSKPITDSDKELIRNTRQAMLDQEFKETFQESQEIYQYDCFKLYEPFRISYPDEYKNMDWAGEYQKVTANIHVAVDLTVTNMLDYNPQE